MKIFKDTLERTFMAMCHDADASYDELLRRYALYRDINPLGPDVSIQMHTYIFSTSDGRLPLSTVSHLKNMVRRVVNIVDVGTNINRILGVMKENMDELNVIRSALSGVPVEELPAFPLNDHSERVKRTRNLVDAVRAAIVPSGQAESEPDAVTTDFVGIFDHNRFFFAGEYPEPFALKGIGEMVADLLRVKFPAEEIAVFVSSRQMDEIIATIEIVVKFYTGLLEQIERTVTFAKSMFESYAMPNTAPIVAAPTPVSSLSRSARNFDHVRVPPGSVHTELPTPGAAAAAASEEADSDVESTEPATKRKTPYRKRLPPPLGMEPAGATTLSPTGVKLFPKPQVMTMAGALLHVVERTGLKGIGRGELAGLIGRLPPTNIVRSRLEEFMQADMRDRYYPALAKILVNYSHDMKLKRITDTGPKHQDLLRMLYLEEHQRVTSGGAKPLFEDLVNSKPDMTPLDSMFTLEELQENLTV